MFTFIYYNSFPTSPLSVAKESTAVEKCVRQPWSWREAPHISTVISLLIHLIVDVKKCVRHFFVRTYPLCMTPLVSSVSDVYRLLLKEEGGAAQWLRGVANIKFKRKYLSLNNNVSLSTLDKLLPVLLCYIVNKKYSLLRFENQCILVLFTLLTSTSYTEENILFLCFFM